jgi:anthranilate phosphoribosyltransferase
MTTVASILDRLTRHEPMRDDELLFLLAELDAGRLTPVQVGALLTALHMLTRVKP